MRTEIILGPPGTGKTTHLLNVLEKEFETVHPSKVAFVSFTKKGTYEGAERAAEKFGLKDSELRYFRTLHSLCFSALNMRKTDMVQKQHYKAFSDAMGMKFLGFYTEELTCNNDMFLFAYSLLRNNTVAGEKLLKEVNIKQYEWVRANYEKFKRTMGIIDFTDLLTNYVTYGKPLPIEVAFVDEAQDLTSLQWLVARKLLSKAKRVYIAGDDDQAIYEWSGADVQKFLSLKGKKTVLSKSYRLPRAIWSYAEAVTHNISERYEKKFSHNGQDGTVEWITNVESILPAPDEDTLILSRNNAYLREVAQHLKNKGVPFVMKGEQSVDPKIVTAIKSYEAWRRGELTDKDVALYKHLFYSFSSEKPWFTVLKQDQETVDYYRMLAATKAKLDKPVVRLETIHSSKGSEADHVILLLDTTKRVGENLVKNKDSELRCYYVGVTRAKKKLTLKLSNVRYGYPAVQPITLQERK